MCEPQTITEKFHIDEPNINIECNRSKKEILSLFASQPLEMVTEDYFVFSARVFGKAISCKVGLHFEGTRLREIEFFRSREYFNYFAIDDSYFEFQTALVAHFGKPSTMKKGTDKYADYIWKFDGVKIIHSVFDRFGLEEHVEIVYHLKKQTAYRPKVWESR